MTTTRRLLVVNPNTSDVVTARIRELSGRIAAPGTVVAVVNPTHGPRAIETAADHEAARPRILELVRAQRVHGFDGCVLACFDDLGMAEIREAAGVPVVAAYEAGFAAARSLAGRFAVITTFPAAVPAIRRLLERHGAADLATVRAAGVGVEAAAAAGAETDARIAEAARVAIEQDGADAIVLGSGALSGRAKALARQVSVPVVDGVEAAIKIAEALGTLDLRQRSRVGAGPEAA